MCTLTIIPFAGGFRAVMSRDELTSRTAAMLPREAVASGVRAVWPVDAQAGGTWIAASELGMVFATLNANPQKTSGIAPEEEQYTGKQRSRGFIIPELAHAESPAHAIELLQCQAYGQCRPFHFVAMSNNAIADARWENGKLVTRIGELSPACFASSGLGDNLVAPRRSLFTAFCEDSSRGEGAAMQDAFHAHTWDDRPEISVRMERPGARTVSRTTIEVPHEGPIALVYRGEDQADSVWSLARATLLGAKG